MRREQEPPGERKGVIVGEKMEKPSAGWKMKTGLEGSWTEEEREGGRGVLKRSLGHEAGENWN